MLVTPSWQQRAVNKKQRNPLIYRNRKLAILVFRHLMPAEKLSINLYHGECLRYALNSKLSQIAAIDHDHDHDILLSEI